MFYRGKNIVFVFPYNETTLLTQFRIVQAPYRKTKKTKRKMNVSNALIFKELGNSLFVVCVKYVHVCVFRGMIDERAGHGVPGVILSPWR